MNIYQRALFILMTAGIVSGQVSATTPDVPEGVNLPLLFDTLMMPDEDENGDTILIALARESYSLPAESRKQLIEPLLLSLLRHGHDPLHENKAGCNAVFYLVGMPDFYQQLTEENLIPRELTLRIPHDEGALVRYMRLRNNQVHLAKTAQSLDYLTRRYFAPAQERAERLMQNYLGATALSHIPEGAMADCLNFMQRANPQAAENFINSLTLWEHGEHFLEEIPACLLTILHDTRWRVKPDLLRLALHKLGSMLPISKDDMIECAASAPMSHILEMLTYHEGNGALPELQHYAAAFDPDIVHTALSLQLKLRKIPRPWDEGFSRFTSPDIIELKDPLIVDAAIRYGYMEHLTAQRIRNAARVWRKHNLPQHADMIESIIDGDTITLPAELRPDFSTRYEELKEDSPHVVLLRFLMQHPETQPQATAEGEAP